MRHRWTDLLTLLIALLASLISILALRDTPYRIPERIIPSAPAPAKDVERPTTLSVSVVDPTGVPVGGAIVQAFWERENSYYLAGSGVSGPSGELNLAALPEGKLWVVARHEGMARGSSQLIAPAGTHAVRVQLGALHRLSVHVQNRLGDPIVEATVLAHALDPLPYASLSDTAGNAVLELGESPWELKVSARGYESTTLYSVDRDSVVTLTPLVTLRVHVAAADHTPAPGAQVFIVGSSLWPARVATTDATGVVAITGLSAGVYDLKATRGSETSGVLFGFEIEVGASPDLTLTLGPGRLITALVVEAREAEWLPVADADVVLVEGGISSFPLRGRSGADGRVTLGPVGSGGVFLTASAPGFVSGRANTAAAGDAEPLRVPVIRGGRLLGEVVDARGFPIDGASVEVIGSDFEGMPLAQTPQTARFQRAHFAWTLPGPPALVPAGELGVMPGPVPPIPLGVAALPGIAAPEEPSAWTSNDNGEFTAWPVNPGKVRALVRHPGFVEGMSQEVVLRPGGEARVRVVLRGGGSIAGRVLDFHRMPVAGARVNLFGINAAIEHVAITATDGTFAFAALPEAVVLEVIDPSDFGRVLVHQRVDVAEGKDVDVELLLPEPREPIDVSVVDDADQPVDAAQVTVVSLDPALPLRRTFYSDATGHLSVPSALGLHLSFEAEADGLLHTLQTFPQAPASVRMTLHQGVIVAGEVTAVRGRVAVADARVTLISQGSRRPVTTDKFGHFQIPRVPPGSARIEVRHPDYAVSELAVVVERTTRSDRPFQLAAIDLAEGAQAVGRVVDQAGQAVQGARVALGLAPTYLSAVALPHDLVITDATGTFELKGLPAGNQAIEAYSTEFGRGRTEVNLVAGQRTEGLEIRLAEVKTEADAANVSVAITLSEQIDGLRRDVVVQYVAPSSEAERAGIKVGDVLTRIAGTAPDSLAAARRLLDGPLRSDVVLEVQRAGAALTLSVQRETVRR